VTVHTPDITLRTTKITAGESHQWRHTTCYLRYLRLRSKTKLTGWPDLRESRGMCYGLTGWQRKSFFVKAQHIYKKPSCAKMGRPYCLGKNIEWLQAHTRYTVTLAAISNSINAIEFDRVICYRICFPFKFFNANDSKSVSTKYLYQYFH